MCLVSIVAAYYMQLVLIPVSKYVSVLPQFSPSLIFVDLVFILCWFRCPFTVACDLDMCISTARSVNPGHYVKLPFFIAAIHVDLTGLKHAACR
jgi:hypothetical protein